ncbi:Methyltransferase [Yersinia mollaretii ATCC 43969]|uniref:Methyltransferase n=1 Tax=Yersinia mollaretii (strain ATCC 43969 / DSM 18520 / CIP 103324 / CNY 7263 / WAIP 204) TaxID=349967 RepID=A0ABM9YEK4_YERMW|nr:class I SAM-dependent methyltransferase [Yersinia mollaretii]EEQ12391.1 Methyltransferase [Yersinia mollaretii ATCC 43969]QKJ03470.1 methyltransferase domain-containing protein [Yersinia mollaretii ATCC 43969]
MKKDKDTNQQTPASEKMNADYFLTGHSDYKKQIESIDTYKFISQALDNKLHGVDKLLDIGNGGIFDYSTENISEIFGLDLFLDSITDDVVVPDNVRMIQGSALDIPESLSNFDAVLMVMLIHHLVGKDVQSCVDNARRSFEEAYRVVKPGGRLLVMDSCVPAWFYAIETRLFKAASWVIERTIKHPPVLQHTNSGIAELMKNVGFGDIEIIIVPKGKYIVQFGVKVPSFITPTQPVLIIGHKNE